MLVLLPLTVKQVRAVACPSGCECLNETVAVCSVVLFDESQKKGDNIGVNLTKMDFSGSEIGSLLNKLSENLNVFQHVHSLNFSRSSISEIRQYTFNGVTKLENLDLSRNSISFIDEKAFVTNVNLSSLWLANNNLTEIHACTFSELNNLRNLDLSNNFISSIKLETFLNNSKLESLCLANNSLTTIYPGTFQSQTCLSYLDLSGNKIRHIKEIFYYNTKLKSLLLANNNISEFHPSAFHAENNLSYIDISGNRIEELENLMFCRLKYLFVARNNVKLLRPRSFSNCKELLNLSLAENNITEIKDGAFCGLENLEYLDLSRNRISSFILPQTEVNNSGRGCVSRIKDLKLDNNEIYSFNFEEYLPLNISQNMSMKFCELKLLNLSGNCLSALDEKSVNVLRNSAASAHLSDNPWLCGCSSSESVYKILRDDLMLRCATQEYLKGKRCSRLQDTCQDITSTLETVSDNEAELDSGEDGKSKKVENLTESEPFLRVNILILGIYAFTICVAIVVVLVITCAVGRPEEDEFWWEDKLAKRDY